MPQVPTYNSEIAPSNIPNVYARADAPIEAFGGGVSYAQGLENTGKQLDSMSQFIEKQKNQADEIRVQDALNKSKALEQNLTWDPQNGFIQKKGQDAFKVPTDYGDRFKSGTDEISNNLDNEEQKKIFALKNANIANSFNENMQKHVGIESKKFSDEVFKSGIELSQQHAVLNYSNPGVIANSIQEQKDIIEKYGASNGLPAETIQADILKAGSKTHSDAIKVMLDNNQDQYAQAYFTKNKDSLTADDLASTQKLLKLGRSDGEAQRQVDQMQSDNLSQSEAYKKAAENSDPLIRKAVEERIDRVYTQIAKGNADSYKKLVQGVTSTLTQSKGTAEIPLSVMAQMSREDAEGTIKYRNQLLAGVQAPPNGSSFQKLSLMASSPDTRNQFANTVLDKYKAEMTDTEFKDLLNKQTGIIQKDGLTSAQLDYADSNEKIKRDTMEKVGIAPGWFSKAEDSAVLEFNASIDMAIKNKEAAVGRKILPEEMQEISNRFATDVVTSNKSSGMWAHLFRPFYGPLAPNKTSKIGALRAEDLDASDIPQKYLDNIKDALKKRGQPVTESNIKQYYIQGLQLGYVKPNGE